MNPRWMYLHLDVHQWTTIWIHIAMYFKLTIAMVYISKTYILSWTTLIETQCVIRSVNNHNQVWYWLSIFITLSFYKTAGTQKFRNKPFRIWIIVLSSWIKNVPLPTNMLSGALTRSLTREAASLDSCWDRFRGNSKIEWLKFWFNIKGKLQSYFIFHLHKQVFVSFAKRQKPFSFQHETLNYKDPATNPTYHQLAKININNPLIW